MKLKKVVALILAGAMTLSMAACGGETTTDSTTTPAATTNNTQQTTTAKKDDATTPTETTTPEPTTEPKSPGEQLAEQYAGFVETPMDLGGRTIKIVSTITKRYQYKTDANGNPDPDNTDNDIVEVVKAIESIEKDYNCNIEFEQLKAKNLTNALITAQSAGDVYCDILEFGCSDTYLEQIYAANLVMDVNDPRIADIMGYESNPWLPASDFALWNGKQLGVHFKVKSSGDIIKAAVLVNKDLLAQYGYEDIYKYYNDKTWTFDTFAQMCASIASQSDGTVYPLVYGKESLFTPVLVYANGGSLADYQDGKYNFTGLTDKTLEAINFAVDLQTKGYIHPSSDSDATTAFANGQAVFMFNIYNELKKLTQGEIECNYEIGLMPGPLGPSGDCEYNGVTYTEHLFHVMDNVEKPEEVAAVLVALANRTSKTDLVETELTYSLQDEESAEVLMQMYNNMKCDYSRSISTTRSLMVNVNKSILKLEKTPKEALEEVASQVQAYFDEYNTKGTITKAETEE